MVAPGYSSFKYFVGATTGSPKGVVILNKEAQLTLADPSKIKRPNCFIITSQGARDPRPVITLLATATEDELQKWLRSLREAILASGGTVGAAVTEAAAIKGVMSSKRASLAQSSVRKASIKVAKEDRPLSKEELVKLKLKELKNMLDEMGVMYDEKTKDKTDLALLIISRRNINATQKAYQKSYKNEPKNEPKKQPALNNPDGSAGRQRQPTNTTV